MPKPDLSVLNDYITEEIALKIYFDSIKMELNNTKNYF